VERTNLRHVDPTDRPPFDAVVADLSFISLSAVMDVLVGSCRPGGWLVLLVKPQFEAGRAEASRGRGVITDPAVWRAALARVVGAAAAAGASMMGVMPSPLHGADGNTEFLLHAVRSDGPVSVDDEVDAALDRAVADAEAAR
jgi:23S rRNA (cytidine1920-2'-O)/16S rRNA (cytidine1409-2'-O)-methyltransferase